MSQLEVSTLIGPDHPAARAAAEEAEEIFTRLGSPPMLGLVKASLSREPTKA